MKTVDPRLAAHLAQETTTLTRLLRIDRLDGTTLRFTDFDADLFYNDTSIVRDLAALWGPDVAEVAPWWITTHDSFQYQSFAGDTAQSHIFSVPTGDTGFLQSQIFAGDTGVGNAHFLGTTAFTKNFTFETYVGLQANNLASTGGLVTGVSTGTAWAGADKYIGFEGAKTAGNAWGNWHLRLSDGVSSTNIDTGVPIFNAILSSWNAPRVKLSFVVNADGTNVNWYVNDRFVGNATVGIPTTPMPMSVLYTSTSSSGDVYYRVESVAVYVPSTSGGTYKSADGVTFSALELKSDGSPNNMQVTGFLDVAGIFDADVRARLYDGATFELRAVNWADLTMGDMKMLSGTIGDYEMKNGLFTAELRGWTQKLTTIVGSLYGPLCRAQLFGGGAEGIDPTNHWKCRLNRADWVQNGFVASSPDSLTIVPVNSVSIAEQLLMIGSPTPTALAPAGWFDDGVIIFTSGVLNGFKFEVSTWDGTTLSLFGGSPMPYAPGPGDTFQIEPGCDKRKTTCFGKFNNIINHAGEADIPGLNVIGAVSRTQVPNS
jgi:uncharacterized phage protein (TIGR02218 family)